jgi:TonB family protein
MAQTAKAQPQMEPGMNPMNHAVLIVIIAFCFATTAFGQDVKPGSSPAPAIVGNKESEVGDDKVYRPQEVDVKAKLKNRSKSGPELKGDCPDSVTVTLRAILHKSGKVKDVVLTQGAGCSFDDQAIEAVRKLTFTPAVKDGQAVSQYLLIQYSGRRSSRSIIFP